MNAERAVRGLLILAAMAFIVWVRTLPLSLATLPEQAELRYQGDDGRSHVYLGDFDSYLWLREARTYLRTGTTCGATVDGQCRDTSTHAPVGRHNRYNRSLHVAAIVALHRLITLFSPGYPLPATAFLVPVIIGALGVLPGFAIGRRLAGDLGGLSAAVAIGCNPIFLQRSLGSDNDVWNVVLPLWMVYAVSEALAACEWRRQVAYAVLAAGFAALHAATWTGWVFTYGVVLGGLVTGLLAHTLRSVLRRRTASVRIKPAVRRTLLVGMVLYVATGLFTSMTGAGELALTLPLTVAEHVVGLATSGATDMAPAGLWPDAFLTVAELSAPNLSAIAGYMGGQLLFFVSWLGLLLLTLPKRRWEWWHFVVLISGNYLYRFLLTVPGLARSTLIILLGLPILAAVLVDLFLDDDVQESDDARWIVIIWFLASLFLSYAGMRFVMLLVPPFGIAFAVAVGRLYDWLRSVTSRPMASRLWIADGVQFLSVAMILVLPMQSGYEAARGYIPRMNDAWWDTLTKIRDESPPDAIVNTWWDYGYWTAYVSERRVTADGGSLATHIPHWFARALLAPSEGESAGLLRMLDCGSDATPEAEGRSGAYGQLLASGVDEITAHSMIVQLASLDRTEARAYLVRHGLGDSAQAEILAATHCTPPPAFLVLTSGLNALRGWRYLGNWDIRKAYIAMRARRVPEAVAVPDLMLRFDYTVTEARSLYTEAAALTSVDDVQNYIAPAAGYVTTDWLPCQHRGDATLACPVGLPIDEHGSVLEEFVYQLEEPSRSRLRVVPKADNHQGAAPHFIDEGTPQFILRAEPERMDEIHFASPTHPDMAVLVDLANARILLGPPYLIRSTFTQLMYLDGRYGRFFEKVDARTSYGGERVVTWRISWDGRD